MTANLRILKKRIGAIKSTKKITSVMKVISSAKLKKAQNQLKNSQLYCQRLNDLMASFVVSNNLENLLKIDNNCCYVVVISADRGLCGSFNANIIKAAEEKINNLKSTHQELKIICVGRKISDFVQKNYPDFIDEKFITAHDHFEIVLQIIAKIFSSKSYPKFWVVYTHFHGLMKQQIKCEWLLPILEDFAAEKGKKNEQIAAAKNIYEPEAPTLFPELLKNFIVAKLYNFYMNSLLSEQCMRMMAMDNATRNAESMINNLTLEYNKSRQAVITKDLIEIISGAEAMKNY